MQEIRERAIIKTKTVQKYNKEYNGIKCKTHCDFFQGDYVMIRNLVNPGENRKLAPKMKGPYVIEKIWPKSSFVIFTDVNGFQLNREPFEGIFDTCYFE